MYCTKCKISIEMNQTLESEQENSLSIKSIKRSVIQN